MRKKEKPNSEKRSASKKAAGHANEIRKRVVRLERKNHSVAPSSTVKSASTPVRSAIDRMDTEARPCYIPIPSSDHEHNESMVRGTALYHKRKTLRDARNRCKECNSLWRRKLLSFVRSQGKKLEKHDRKELRALLGLIPYVGPVRASDIGATRKFGLICADVVHSYSLAAPELRWFHLTLLAGEIQVKERKPALALKRLKGKAYKSIQELGLDALVWIDVDALPNYPQGGEGGTFMPHCHAIGFTDDRSFDLARARAKLKRSRSWSTPLQAVPTNIKEITGDMGTPAWWAQYDAKPPYRAKRLIVSDDGGAKLVWTDHGYRPQIAMRLAEGLSQIALFDRFFAVGEGKALREETRKRMNGWHRRRWAGQDKLDLTESPSLLRRVWRVTRVKYYKKWRIIGSSI